MNLLKKCIDINCGEEYDENTSEYFDEECTVCGKPLESIEVDNDFDKCTLIKDTIIIDSLGYIHSLEDIELEDKVKLDKDRIDIYIYDKIQKEHRLYNSFEFNYDEITIGRNSITFCPDIDLTNIDPEKHLSRKHVLIYRENNGIYIRNESQKNTLHLNSELVEYGESKLIPQKNTIVMSGYIFVRLVRAGE